jgi:hypothetical protein
MAQTRRHPEVLLMHRMELLEVPVLLLLGVLVVVVVLVVLLVVGK